MDHTSRDGEIVLRLTVAMIILTGLAVFLRFLTRFQTKASPAADDWWLVASLVFFYTYMGMQLWCVTKGGIGYPLTSLPYPLLVKSVKLLFVSTPFSVSTTAAAKISILCLYRRIFPTESFRRNSLLLGVVVVGYWFSASLGAVLRCIPVKVAYEPLIPGRCIDFAAFFLGLELLNCVLDILMLCLPLQVIRKLNMPLQSKIQLSFIFLLGSLVLVAGIIRMAVIYKAGSTELSLTGDLIFATIENGLAIICACLPTYRPLLSKCQTLAFDVVTKYTSLIRGTQEWQESRSKKTGVPMSAEGRIIPPRNHYDQIDEESGDKPYLAKAIGGKAGDDDFIAGRDFPLHTINVKSSTEIL